MFKIEYRIIDDIEALKKYTAEEFRHHRGESIYGLFQITFGDKTIGFYEEDDMPEQISDFFEELIETWFDFLSEVLVKSKKHSFIALRMIETPHRWIEFIIKENYISVNLVEYHIERLPGDRVSSIITEPLKLKHDRRIVWENVKISKKDFENEIISKTKQLLKEIEEINPRLLESGSIRRIISSLEEIEKV